MILSKLVDRKEKWNEINMDLNDISEEEKEKEEVVMMEDEEKNITDWIFDEKTGTVKSTLSYELDQKTNILKSTNSPVMKKQKIEKTIFLKKENKDFYFKEIIKPSLENTFSENLDSLEIHKEILKIFNENNEFSNYFIKELIKNSKEKPIGLIFFI
jgi:hypothetical protein